MKVDEDWFSVCFKEIRKESKQGLNAKENWKNKLLISKENLDQVECCAAATLSDRKPINEISIQL